MKKIIIISLCSALVTLMMNCSQKEEDTTVHNSDLNTPTYQELSNIEYQEDTREIRHEVKEGFSYSSADVK